MGQAVADLPNPLDAAPPASVSGADDLLAQLAGDEIDRLLAEADVPRPAPGETKPATGSPASVAAPALVEPAPAPVIEPAAVAEVASPATDELDRLLNELTPEASPEQPKPKSLTEQVPEVLAAAGVAEAAPPEPLDGVMSPAEREALNLSNLEAATHAAEQLDADLTATTATIPTESATSPATESVVDSLPPARPNLAVRVLEWVNAPLSFVPDAGRDALGKVAILTIVNSLAVLAYVLFFRHGQ